jgi:thiamine biosynthesis lipoprotein
MPVEASLPLRRLRPVLGCFVEVGIAAMRADVTAAQAIDAAYATLQRVHDSLSFHSADSELTRLNQSRGARVGLSPLALRVLRLAKAMTARSGGRFNCCVGGALVRAGRLPDHGGHYLDAGVAEDLQLEAGGARLRRPVLVTLDGIAKGYAVDAAIATLKRNGARTGWVNAGGDLRVFGEFTLPVRLRSDVAGPTPVWGIRDAALACSGGGIDTATFPGVIIEASSCAARPGNIAVLANRAWRADALTKVAACTSGAHREQLLQRLGGRLVISPQAQAA